MKGQRLLAFLVSVVAAVAVALLANAPAVGRLTGLERLEYLTLDYRQRISAQNLRVEAGVSDPVVLVLFDSTAVMDWPYLSPFPRPVLAELINSLSAAGARTIGLDVYLDRLFPNLEGDQELHDAIAQAGNVVLAAMTVESDSGRVLRPPHPYFAEVAAGVGAADLPTAFDVVRDGLLLARDGPTQMVPGLSLALYAHSQGISMGPLLDEARAGGRLVLPGLPAAVGEVPEEWRAGEPSTVDRLSFPVRYLGPRSNPEWADAEGVSGTFPAYSASFTPTLAMFTPEFFRDRIVLLGTGFHDSDKFRTPFYDVPLPASLVAEGGAASYGWTFGVEVHANALQNMLDSSFIRTAGMTQVALLILLAALIPAAVTFGLGTGWGAAAALMTMAGVTLLAFSVFAGGFGGLLPGPYLWLPIVVPVLGIGVSYLTATAYVAVVEGREKRFIRRAFGKYVSPDVVAEISKDPESLKLGGQKRQLSLLFSDLAGFTDLSESLDPEELLALLNEYLTEMTTLVMEEGGTLDKYIGDAIMAFWNAPQDQPDHADRALRCAIRMQRRMGELNARWASEGRQTKPFVVRIGLNSGTVVVGNVGGEERFDYSAIGDEVNLAARLEPANKSYETLTMVSEFLVNQASPAAYRLRELDLLAVKGKTLPVRVFEVVEEVGVDLGTEKEQVLKHYESGLRSFRERDWELAQRYFEAALECDPGDGPSKVYLKRSLEFQQSPPVEDWDFVVRRTTK